MLFTAFTRNSRGEIRQLDSVEQACEAMKDSNPLSWLDIENPTPEALEHIRQSCGLDAEAIEDCLQGQQRPRIDEFDDYIFLVAYSMPTTELGDELITEKIAIFCSQRYLITVHRGSLPTVAALRKRCAAATANPLAGGADLLLFHLLDGMTDRYVMFSQQVHESIDRLDDQQAEEGPGAAIIDEVTRLRRLLIDLRHIAFAQRDLIAPLVRGEYEITTEKIETRFSHVQDHLTKLIEQIDGMREMLSSIRDSHHAALAMRTNEIMQTLTVFATIMLPLSLIAGIYGMNVPLWPSPDDPGSFWVVLGVMAVVTGGMLLMFRKRRWL
jgi:magnesium transporter